MCWLQCQLRFWNSLQIQSEIPEQKRNSSVRDNILKNKRGVLQLSTGDRQKEEKGACSLRRRLNKIQRPACRKKSDWLHTKTFTVATNPETSRNISPLSTRCFVLLFVLGLVVFVFVYFWFFMKTCSIFSEAATESSPNSTSCVHSTFTTEQSTVQCCKCEQLHKAVSHGRIQTFLGRIWDLGC